MMSTNKRNRSVNKNYLEIKLCDMENLLTIVTSLRMNNLKNCHRIENEINKMAEEQISLIRNRQKILLDTLYEKGDNKNKILSGQEDDLQYCINACKDAIKYSECIDDINELEKDEKINTFIDKINFLPLKVMDRNKIIFSNNWEVLKNIINKVGTFDEIIDNDVGALLPPPMTVLEKIVDDKDEVLAYTSPLSIILNESVNIDCEDQSTRF
uniref:Mediator complex subunit 4 n=1 Tax=Parastrongyloides trichosuri TaxID=131310 RepID=A0A0N5A5K7_PARTI